MSRLYDLVGATNMASPDLLEPAGLVAPVAGLPYGFVAPPGLEAPAGFMPPPGLSLPFGFRAPPGLAAPDEESDAGSDRCGSESATPVREWNSAGIIHQLNSKAKGLAIEFSPFPSGR